MTTQTAPTTDHDELLDTDAAAKLVGLKPRTMKVHRITGRGPKFIRLNRQVVRYRRQDLADFIAARTVDPEAGK